MLQVKGKAYGESRKSLTENLLTQANVPGVSKKVYKVNQAKLNIGKVNQ